MSRTRGSARAGLVLWLFGLCAMLSGFLLPVASSAGSAFDVAGSLRGARLGQSLEMLEDPSGKLSIETVQKPASNQRFRYVGADAPALGFTDSAYWLRFTVENSSESERAWLLELAYPLIDDVVLYVPRASGGFAQRKTGDMRPFKERDIAYRNFVFTLEEPPHTTHVYYMRVATKGSMTLPLVGWTLREFLEHQHLDWAGLCIFYGVVMIMALYNASVALFARQREYLPYAAYLSFLAVYELTRSGHAFQFLLPEHPLWVHRLSPASLALTFFFACTLCAAYDTQNSWYARSLRYSQTWSLAMFGLSWIAPYALSVKLITATAAVLLLLQIYGTFDLFRRREKQAALLLVGWGSITLGALVSMLLSVGLVPASFLTSWSTHIGLSVQVVLLASALAHKINSARAELSALNEALSSELDAVSKALRSAEHAGQRAERATGVRDEFIATMSHEFRTPLNPIINIPQGMRDEFARFQIATCTACKASFELEDGEVVDADTACPDCSARGALQTENVLRYTGDPARARKLLTMVEHSGNHLLRVVNGILEFSKMEAGQLTLVREDFDARPLVEEIVAEMRDVAERADVHLVCQFGHGMRPAQGDTHRVREVLSHLIDNAIKFRRGPSQVTISVRDEGRATVFSVEDQGVGIAKEHIDTVFTSFEQVYKGNTRRYGGTGLGLSIARSLVAMHGGQISVKSELGTGSVFSFRLPRITASLSALSPSVPPRKKESA